MAPMGDPAGSQDSCQVNKPLRGQGAQSALREGSGGLQGKAEKLGM